MGNTGSGNHSGNDAKGPVGNTKSMDCKICLEVGIETFQCPSRKCSYSICTSCTQNAFEDATGSNSAACPFCKTPIARALLESMCGKGAVRAVEDELRPLVEHQVRKEQSQKDERKVNMGEMKERARILYLQLAEQLNTLKCPRCSALFDDYDGCNAVRCRCGASFCSICLEYCPNDAHEHVRSVHGDLYDKSLFTSANHNRQKMQVVKFMQSIEKESFEVQELVRISYEQSFPECSTSRSIVGGRQTVTSFLTKAQASLSLAVRNDRLSILADGEWPQGRIELTSDHISPRSAIPDEYRLRLQGHSTSRYTISLERLINDRWIHVPLPHEEHDETDPDGTEQDGTEPVVDVLINVKRKIQCGIIAFRGARCLYQSVRVSCGKEGPIAKDEVSVCFCRIDKKGNVVGQEQSLHSIGCLGEDIIGLNQNDRLQTLETHVARYTASGKGDALVFPALGSYVGATAPQRLLNDPSVASPETFRELNVDQQRVAHPLSLRTAMEVAGPPGTGKTKTITELVRSLLDCTDFEVIVLSERNGAIDAIAEKFAGGCLKGTGRNIKVTNFHLWECLSAFGSKNGMGPSTSLFTLESKIKMHPEMVELRRVANVKRDACDGNQRSMLDQLCDLIKSMMPLVSTLAMFSYTGSLIKLRTEPGLSRGTEVITSLQGCKASLEGMLETDFDEEAFSNWICKHEFLVGDLFPLRSRDDRKRVSWKSYKRVSGLAVSLLTFQTKLADLLRMDVFSLTKAESLAFEARKAEEAIDARLKTLRDELINGARLLLSTIGSSHKLPVRTPDRDEDDDITETFSRLTVTEATQSKTVVVFDESGCIPAYEFLGLSRLGRNIEAIVCVGDKLQLAPYAPASQMNNRNRQGQGVKNKSPPESVLSLLDVSELKESDGSRIKLTTQYRVPRDIANVLNARIYRGDYITAASCSAPARGFHFLQVPKDRGLNSKNYINRNELDNCMELVRQLKCKSNKSVMILTPYKKQQRQLEFRCKQGGYKDLSILTIDQCQGRESDYVILSLVQKPTRFMTKNRWNVALSRVRQHLFVLGDRCGLREGSRNAKYDSHALVSDLLEMADDDDSDKSFGDYLRGVLERI